MSGSRDHLVESLRHYASLLSARKQALEALSRTSDDIRATLEQDGPVDIAPILGKREEQCQALGDLCRTPGPSRTILAEAARESAEQPGGELGKLARAALSLQNASDDLAQRLIACQAECEDLLRARVEATAQAIRESARRRRLDAAYGPACNQGNPSYLDKQR